MASKKISVLIAELRSWLPNYDHGPTDYPTILYRTLAALPGGEELEDMGYEPIGGLGWHEADLLGRVLEAIQDKRDVEDLVAALMNEGKPKGRKPIVKLIEELRSWLPNYDHGPDSFPTTLYRFLASAPGGEELDGIYEPIGNLGWQELDQLGRVLEAIQGKRDVEEIVAGLTSEEEEVEEGMREAGKRVAWNQAVRGNVHVSDGAEGFWAQMRPDVTAQEALDEYMSTADYSAATGAFTVTAEVLSGKHEGDTKTLRVGPGGEGMREAPRGRSTSAVRNSETNEKLPGTASNALVRASRKAGPSGIVSAYYSHGEWLPVAPGDVDHFERNLGVEIVNVYVDDYASAEEGMREASRGGRTNWEDLYRIENNKGRGFAPAQDDVRAAFSAYIADGAEPVQRRHTADDIAVVSVDGEGWILIGGDARGKSAWAVRIKETDPRVEGNEVEEGMREAPGPRESSVSTEAHELALYTVNDGQIYRQTIQPIIENLAAKIRKGTYDAELAINAWAYAADAGAKKYTKEFGGGGRNGSFGAFSKADRMAAAREIGEQYDEEVRAAAGRSK
jgi:hypothetical protein